MEEVVNDNMRYGLDYCSESEMLKITASGTMEVDGFDEVADVFWRMLNEHNCYRAFVDYRDFQFAKCTINLVKRSRIAMDREGAKYMKMAVLVRQVDQNHHFLETMYVNNGADVKVFTNRGEAELWLLM